MYKSKITLIFILCFTTIISAQDFKFGKVSEAEVNEKVYPNDTSAVAAYLLKNRRSYYVYNTSTGLDLITEIHERVKIYDKNGFDYATEIINLSKGSGGNKEMVSGIKGITYTMENGAMVETKLEKSGIFKSEYSKTLNQTKITMPNVKEGCVLEYKYKISSPYIQSIDEFRFQEAIPIKKIKASMSIIDYFKFNQRQKGFLLLNAKTTSETNSRLSTKNIITSYDLSNIPAMKDESFVSNIDNYRAGVNFEIVSLQIPGRAYQNYAQTWENVVETVYKSDAFGTELKRSKYFEDDLDAALAGVVDNKKKIQTVLSFVKKKVKWNKKRGVGTDEGVKKAYKDGTGNTADINLMLVAMLKHAGLDAYPIMLSTRDNGISLFPTLDGFNYVIAGIKNGDSYEHIDATESFSSTNVLPMRALNWLGRVVAKDGSSDMVDLMPQKKSIETSMLDVSLTDDGSIEGVSKQRFSNYYAMLLRKRFADNTEDKYLEELEKNYDGVEISNFQISNQNDTAKPLGQSFDIVKEDCIEETSSKLYFSPLFYLATDESPFKSKKREFPVDFGYPWEDRFIVKIAVPEGYKIENLPENTVFALPNKMGNFKYNISEKGGAIQLSSSITFNKSLIGNEYYEALQEFYRQVIEKQSEKVVLSKI